jgi:hypothetical protein
MGLAGSGQEKDDRLMQGVNQKIFRKETIWGRGRIWEDNVKTELKNNWFWRCELESSGSVLDSVTALCEHGDKLSGSMRGERIFD